MIRKLKPDVVITHYPKETGGFGNPHAAAGEIVMLAINLASGVDPGDSNPPHRVAQIFFFGAGAASIRTHLGGADGGFTNDVFIDITDVAHLKVACLDALESQGYGGAQRAQANRNQRRCIRQSRARRLRRRVHPI